MACDKHVSFAKVDGDTHTGERDNQCIEEGEEGKYDSFMHASRRPGGMEVDGNLGSSQQLIPPSRFDVSHSGNDMLPVLLAEPGRDRRQKRSKTS